MRCETSWQCSGAVVNLELILTLQRSPMRKSKAIALSLLGLGAASLSGGCGSSSPTEPTPAETSSADNPSEPTEVMFEPDDVWYDKDGKEIATEWQKDPNGEDVPVAQPYDRLGRPWVYDENRTLVPPPPILVRIIQSSGSMIYVYRIGGTGLGTPAMVPLVKSGLGAHGSRVGIVGA